MCVCLYVPCGHLLGKGWPPGSHLWYLIVSLSLSHWYPGCGIWLDRFLIFAPLLSFTIAYFTVRKLHMCWYFTDLNNRCADQPAWKCRLIANFYCSDIKLFFCGLAHSTHFSQMNFPSLSVGLFNFQFLWCWVVFFALLFLDSDYNIYGFRWIYHIDRGKSILRSTLLVSGHLY